VTWLPIVLVAALAAAPAPKRPHRVGEHGRLAKQAPRHKGVKVKRPAPQPAAPAGAAAPAAPAPDPVTTPAPAPSATPAPSLPSRTRVVLQDDPYTLQSSYITMKSGPIEFNVLNAGMDDHNLTIRGSGATVFAPAGEEAQLVATLQPGTYRLYCSLLNHEQLGMWTTLTVK
jgi:plastocyanin